MTTATDYDCTDNYSLERRLAWTAGAYKAITAGGLGCAIATEDTMTCWNLSDAGPTDAPAGTYKAVSSSSGGPACAVAIDDTITCWGPVPPPEGIRWLATRWLSFRQLKILD